MKQLELFTKKTPAAHGGDLAAGRRKTMRPLAKRRPLHFVLKAKRRLPSHRSLVQEEILRKSARFGLRIYKISIASDHVHFLAKIPGRQEYRGFIRALTGVLARKLGRGLWRVLPFSRLANWGRDFARLKIYLEQNTREALGLQSYQPRRNWYARHLRKTSSS